MTAEDDRALAWRAQQVRRALYVRQTQLRLRGSVSARQRLADAWAAVINRTQPDAGTEETPNG